MAYALKVGVPPSPIKPHFTRSVCVSWAFQHQAHRFARLPPGPLFIPFQSFTRWLSRPLLKQAVVAKCVKLSYKSFGSVDHCFRWACLRSCSPPFSLLNGDSLRSINTSPVLYGYDNGNSDFPENPYLGVHYRTLVPSLLSSVSHCCLLQNWSGLRLYVRVYWGCSQQSFCKFPMLKIVCNL